MDEFLRQARALLPWLPETLIQTYADSFAETQNADIAIAEVRKSPEYAQVFPKNIRDDGTVRLSEQDYAAVKESFGLTLEDYGLNPEYFQGTFADLIEVGVAPNEFRARVEAARSGIVENVPAVKEYYRTNFGMDLNDNQIFASIIDPAIGEAIIEGRITQAQIGGEAAARGFALSPEETQALERAGLTQSQARQLFAQAEAEVPRLAELTRRFQPEAVEEPGMTPEGLVERPDYDIEEFIQAQVFGSAEERERIQRLQAQEESEFTPTTGALRAGRRVRGLVEE
tara:strand:+ start:1169 stop:2023 length:855 start_codon:yes stop_codon:yes gene_type:complete